MKNRRSSFFISFFFFLFSFFTCKTVPQMSEAAFDAAGFVPLDPGAYACVFADAQSARPILDKLSFIDKNDKRMQQMIDKTRFAVAAVYLPQDVRRYQLAAWGTYPASSARMALGVSRGWKKFRSSVSGSPYWYSGKNRLAVAVSAGEARVSASAGDAPTDPFSASPGMAIPEGFSEFRRGAALSCWLDNPGLLIGRKLEEAGIPIELPAGQLFVSLFPVQGQAGAEHQYEVFLQMHFSGAAQARALATLFTIARGFVSLGSAGGKAADGGTALLAAVFFANPPEQDGNKLNIKSNALSAQEVSLLFNLFSL